MAGSEVAAYVFADTEGLPHGAANTDRLPGADTLAFAGAQAFRGTHPMGLSECFADGVGKALPDRFSVPLGETFTCGIADAFRIGISLAPALGLAGVGHVHHRDGQVSGDAFRPLQLAVPFGHIQLSPGLPRVQRAHKNRGSQHLDHIFVVYHASDKLFQSPLAIWVDALIAHTLVPGFFTGLRCLGDTPGHGQIIHGIHLLPKPFGLLGDNVLKMHDTKCALQHGAETDKV